MFYYFVYLCMYNWICFRGLTRCIYCTIALPDRLLSLQWPGLRWDTVRLAEIHCHHLRCTADDCHMGLHLNIYTMTLLYTTLLILVSSFACYSFSEASSVLKAFMYLWVSDCDNLPISITIFSNHNSCWNERGWQN